MSLGPPPKKIPGEVTGRAPMRTNGPGGGVPKDLRPLPLLTASQRRCAGARSPGQQQGGWGVEILPAPSGLDRSFSHGRVFFCPGGKKTWDAASGQETNSSKGLAAMGRPAFKPSEAQRRQVAAWAGAGASHWDIARALGISRPTLRAHMHHELTAGAARRRMEVLLGLYLAARRGRVSAALAFTNAWRRAEHVANRRSVAPLPSADVAAQGLHPDQPTTLKGMKR